MDNINDNIDVIFREQDYKESQQKIGNVIKYTALNNK